MQAPDGSSPGARRALIAIATDLKLQPIVVARALEYAFDNEPSFPNATQALCFGIVRQGRYVDMQLLNVTLQRLRRDFGGILVAPSAQRVPHVMTNLQSHNDTPAHSIAPRVLGYSDDSRYQAASTSPSLPQIGTGLVPNASGGTLSPSENAETAGGRHLAETYGAF